MFTTLSSQTRDLFGSRDKVLAFPMPRIAAGFQLQRQERCHLGEKPVKQHLDLLATATSHCHLPADNIIAPILSNNNIHIKTINELQIPKIIPEI